jgi:hypothetical protein
MIDNVIIALAWLSISSVAVMSGRFLKNPLLAYPVGATASFLLFSLMVNVITAIPAQSTIFEVGSFPATAGGN